MTDYIIMVGPSASGKSTYAEQLKANYERRGEEAIIVSSDSIRVELFNNINDLEHNEEVFEEVNRRVAESLGKKNVIVDATSVDVKSRAPLLRLALKVTDVRKIAMVMTTPYWVCKKQNRNRERSVPGFAIDRQFSRFEIPCYGEGFDAIHLIIHARGTFFNAKERLADRKADPDFLPNLLSSAASNDSLHIDSRWKECADRVAERTDNEAVVRAAMVLGYGQFLCQKDSGCGDFIQGGDVFRVSNMGVYSLMHTLEHIGLDDYDKCLECLLYANYLQRSLVFRAEATLKEWAKKLGQGQLDNLMLLRECCYHRV